MRVKGFIEKTVAGLVLGLTTVFAAFGQVSQPVANNAGLIAGYTGEGRSVESRKERNVRTATESEVTELAAEEGRAILGLYTNYLADYRLGPSDVISIEIFGQCPDYCKTGINVPPTAKISYPLIREGIFVGGKTVDEVSDEIADKLKDYINDPKVTVTLEKPMSNKYSVTGKVSQPGIKIMDRRLSVMDAILEAGGYTRDSNRSEAMIIRFTPDGEMMKYKVDLDKISKGKAPMIFLSPGDQVYVPAKAIRVNVNSVFETLNRIAFIRYFFGIPF